MPCVLEAHLQPLAGAVVRITDRQGYQASERWTESLQEQARLEALIERVKPPAPPGQHRLLTTPFRYPPLLSGSRFTAADQRELFYGEGAWARCWPSGPSMPCGFLRVHRYRPAR